MSELTDKTNLTDGDTSEAAFQAEIGKVWDVLDEQLTTGGLESISINSSGTLTPTKAFVEADTYNSSASDNLDFISTTNIGTKKLLMLKIKSSARPITVRHNQSGTGKLFLLNEVDITLSRTDYVMLFFWDVASSRWQELDRNFGVFVNTTAEKTAIRALLGLEIGADVQAQNANLNNFAGKAAPTGNVVGTNDAQSLTNKVISAATNTISGITEAMLSLSNNITLNSSTTRHGFLPKLSGLSYDVMLGDGNWGSLETNITKTEIFSSTTWNKPTGINWFLIYFIGAGGEGGTLNSGGNAGANAESSSFGDYFTCTGGNGGGGQSAGNDGVGGIIGGSFLTLPSTRVSSGNGERGPLNSGRGGVAGAYAAVEQYGIITGVGIKGVYAQGVGTGLGFYPMIANGGLKKEDWLIGIPIINKYSLAPDYSYIGGADLFEDGWEGSNGIDSQIGLNYGMGGNASGPHTNRGQGGGGGACALALVHKDDLSSAVTVTLGQGGEGGNDVSGAAGAKGCVVIIELGI